MKLHLGCGSRILEGYDNIDIVNCEGVTHVLDIGKERLPYTKSSVDEIRCSHVIEHLEYHDFEFLLEECYRVLKLKGELKINCPSLVSMCYNYIYSFENDWIEGMDSSVWCLYGQRSELPELHKWGYDIKSLTPLLEYKGFSVSVIEDTPTIGTIQEHGIIPNDVKVVAKK